MTKQEAIAYAKELMRSRKYCEIATNRILLLLSQLSRDVSMKEVEDLVIGRR